MIIFINGAFGVGKTTIAETLVSRIPNSLLFDPEEVGYFLRNVVNPIEQFEDFQDLAMWRPLVVITAKMLKETYGRTLVMPMTIWHLPYFKEVLAGLRQFEPDLYHFCLTASVETIHNRLKMRPNSSQAYAWCNERIERCVEAFKLPEFAVQIATDGREIEEIVDKLTSIFNCATPPLTYLPHPSPLSTQHPSPRDNV
jgi:AAA domain